MNEFFRILSCAGCSKNRKLVMLQHHMNEQNNENENPNNCIKRSKALEHYNTGCSLQEQGKLEDAIECYRQCLALTPTHIETNYNLAITLQELNLLDESERFYKKTISLDRNHHMAYYNLGYLYQDRGRMEMSVECFTNASRIQPNDVDTLINLGLALKHQGRHNESIQHYQKAIQYDPNCIMAYFNLGNVYQDLKAYNNAIKCFKNVIKIDSHHVDAIFNLAISYHDRGMLRMNDTERINDLNEALVAYRYVYTILPSLDDANIAAIQIEQLLNSLCSNNTSEGSSGVSAQLSSNDSNSSVNLQKISITA